MLKSKTDIRNEIKLKKSRLLPEDIARRSAILADKLFAAKEYKEASDIYIYISYNQEVMTGPIIERALSDGKRVAVPRTFPGGMEFIYINDSTEYTVVKGIKEPVNGQAADTDALVIVPGLAFGKDMNRYGYGGGYYDRYFSSHPDRKYVKAALCYDFQVYDTLESEEHDEKIDILITDCCAERA